MTAFYDSYEIVMKAADVNLTLSNSAIGNFDGLTFNAAAIDSRFGTAQEHLRLAEEICGMRPICSIGEAEPIGPKKLLDILVIAPCTGNTLAKLAHGIADTPVTMAAKSHLRNGRPVLLAPATNDALSGSAENIGRLLARKNIYFVPFRQDDPVQKPHSLVADFSKIGEVISKPVDYWY